MALLKDELRHIRSLFEQKSNWTGQPQTGSGYEAPSEGNSGRSFYSEKAETK